MSVSLAISSFTWARFYNPNTAIIVVFIGLLGVYWEFCRPGSVAPGVIGAVLAIAGVAGLVRFPIDWRGALLILLSFILLAADALFGLRHIATLAGAGALLRGATMLVDSSDARLRIHFFTALAISVPFAAVTSFLFSVAVRARRNKVVRRYPERKT